ncbi:MAG: hypothetical protein ACK5O2_14415 [Microthrixaceae bacterium]
MCAQVASTVGLTAGASVLSVHRDFGAGMLPQRAGRASGSPWLSSTLGLAVRLQRSSIIGWGTGVGRMVAAMAAYTPAVAVLGAIAFAV